MGRNTTEEVSPLIIPIISLDEVVFALYILYIISTAFIFLGIASNIVSICVYFKMGVQDSVNLSFFFLCISDFAFLAITSVCAICAIMGYGPGGLTRPWHVHPLNVKDFTYWFAVIFYNVAMFLRVFIAIGRCCLVALPLHFKNMFTKRRTLFVVYLIALSVVAMRIPMLTTQFWVEIPNPRTNSSNVVLKKTDSYPVILLAQDILNRNVITWLCFLIVLLSFFILATELRKAAAFRHTKKNTESGSKNGKTPMSGKELRVVKSVTLISATFVVLAIPFVCYSLWRAFLPSVGADPRYGYLFSLIQDISQFCGYLNAGTNGVIFYQTNTKFRHTFAGLLSASQSRDRKK